MAKLELSAIVRDVCKKFITIENPLAKIVEITKEMLISGNENVSFETKNFSIPAH